MKEIILLGTIHFPGGFDLFSDEVQRDIESLTEKLAELKPTKIAVEMPMGSQEKIDELYQKFDVDSVNKSVIYGEIVRYQEQKKFHSENEVVQIGFRLANKLGHQRVYGIDEDVELSDELVKKVLDGVMPYLETEQQYIKETTEMTPGTLIDVYKIHNSEKFIQLDNDVYMRMNKVNLGSYEGSQLVLQWYERNLKIFSNLQNICEDGDRVLVIIGSAHLKILRDFVNGTLDMRLVDYD